MRKTIYILLLIATMWGCDNETPMEIPAHDPASIYLTAVTGMTETTRTPYEYTVPNRSNEGILRTEVWATSNKGTYFSNDWNGKNHGNDVAIHTLTNFDSEHPKLLNQAVYPQSGTPVYFIGLHPQNMWQLSDDGKKTSCTFTGCEDLMYATRKEGQYASPDPTLGYQVRELYFQHLLTLVNIKMVAEDQMTTQAWGKITDIKISSKNTCSINIGNEGTQNVNSDVDYGYSSADAKKLPLFKKGTNEIFPTVGGYLLDYYPNVSTPQEVAYVMCSPVDAIKTVVVDGNEEPYYEYTLDIVTERRNVSIPIDLRINSETLFEGSTRSRSFTLTLTFKMGNTILVSGDVVDWTFEGNSNVEL